MGNYSKTKILPLPKKNVFLFPLTYILLFQFYFRNLAFVNVSSALPHSSKSRKVYARTKVFFLRGSPFFTFHFYSAIIPTLSRNVNSNRASFSHVLLTHRTWPYSREIICRSLFSDNISIVDGYIVPIVSLSDTG